MAQKFKVEMQLFELAWDLNILWNHVFGCITYSANSNNAEVIAEYFHVIMQFFLFGNFFYFIVTVYI